MAIEESTMSLNMQRALRLAAQMTEDNPRLAARIHDSLRHAIYGLPSKAVPAKELCEALAILLDLPDPASDLNLLAER